MSVCYNRGCEAYALCQWHRDVLALQWEDQFSIGNLKKHVKVIDHNLHKGIIGKSGEWETMYCFFHDWSMWMFSSVVRATEPHAKGHHHPPPYSILPYSGLYLWVEIFVKSWKRLSELNFVVLNFVARWYIFDCGWRNELWTNWRAWKQSALRNRTARLPQRR